MAGAFAHITLVDEFCLVGNEIDKIAGMPNWMKDATGNWSKFCELGAVSPDCPYLKLGSSEAEGWGNVMHYWRTADFVRFGIKALLDMNPAEASTQKCLAWLLGYVAHVVTDLTIHPVIVKRVGDYEHHKSQHRECELNQDAYIFHEMKKQDITVADFLQGTGIGACVGESGKGLDPAICQFWQDCLNGIRAGISMEVVCPHESPEPDEWFRHYVFTIGDLSEEAGKIFLLGRVLCGMDVAFPKSDNVDRTYIDNLITPPVNAHMIYDQVFERTRRNVAETWGQLAIAIEHRRPEEFSLQNGNLDTGLADNDCKSIFWGEGA